jgi:hypothetical protein
MAKFKVGQVVAESSELSANRVYHYITGISQRQYKDGKGVPIYFVDGDLATKNKDGTFHNAFWFESYFRKLTRREAGR